MREFARPLGIAVGVGLALGAVVSVVAHVTGHSVRPWLTCALTVTAVLLVVALYESAHRVFGAEPAVRPAPQPEVLTDRKRGGLDATVRMVERGMSDQDRFATLRTRIVRLTDDRLQQTHGVDVHFEPERARALLGDGLVDLVEGTPRRLPRRADLEEWLTRLEQL